jgi:Ser/Thr protein kinase RdoA (MazF antagonist)
MHKKTIIGIDPGLGGGIAYAIAGTNGIVALPMPETEGDILDLLKNIRTESGAETPVAVIEELTGFVGHCPVPGYTMFKLGRNLGLFHGALSALGFRIETARPQKWQAALGMGTSKGLKKHQWKAKLKAKAQQLFPETKATLKTADALLLLEFGKKEAQ